MREPRRRLNRDAAGSYPLVPGVEDPGPVGEGDIDALLPKRVAEFGRKLVQHRLDRGVREVTQIGVHRFAGEERHRLAVRSDRAVRHAARRR